MVRYKVIPIINTLESKRQRRRFCGEHKLNIKFFLFLRIFAKSAVTKYDARRWLVGCFVMKVVVLVVVAGMALECIGDMHRLVYMHIERHFL